MKKIFSHKPFRLAVAWFINSLAFSIIYPFLPLYLHNSRGFDMVTVGLIFPAMGIGVILGPPASGVLVDYLGRRCVLIGGPLLRGIAFTILAVLAAYDASFAAFAVMLTITAFFGTFFQNASDAYLTDITLSSGRPRAYGMIRIGTNIGFALGPMLGAFLARTPFALLFGITAGLLVGGSLFIALTCPEPNTGEAKVKSEVVKFNWRNFFKGRDFLWFIVFALMLYILISQLYSMFSIYATNIGGVGRNKLGIIYSLNGVAVVLLQLPMTHVLDRLRMRMFLRLGLGCLIYCFGFFMLAAGTGFYYYAILVIIITTGEIIAQPAVYAAASIMAPVGMIGRYMGIIGLVRGIGYSLGPWLGSILFSKYSDQPFLLWGILTIFGLIAGSGYMLMAINSKR